MGSAQLEQWHLYARNTADTVLEYLFLLGFPWHRLAVSTEKIIFFNEYSHHYKYFALEVWWFFLVCFLFLF